MARSMDLLERKQKKKRARVRSRELRKAQVEEQKRLNNTFRLDEQ